eukprot:TRINITY_DN1239_c1_g1_i3.p2 TRINITY_DN1239_c1_g1~~TRINITY_DN1239_c1_g1_i3.p2  ORF type:complete len:122 (-),score=2.35 TRINITY_DN1239_c1_g1_i3:594-959(-)
METHGNIKVVNGLNKFNKKLVFLSFSKSLPQVKGYEVMFYRAKLAVQFNDATTTTHQFKDARLLSNVIVGFKTVFFLVVYNFQAKLNHQKIFDFLLPISMLFLLQQSDAKQSFINIIFSLI